MAEGGSRRTVQVKGIHRITSTDTLENYFSSSKRGGDISSINHDSERGSACIVFATEEGARQALGSEHSSIDGVSLTLRAQPLGTMESHKLYVEGFDEVTTTKDTLKYYVERISAADVLDVTFGFRCNAVVTVDSTFDFEKVQQLAKEKSLAGKYLRIDHVPVCRSIKVVNLPESATHESVLLKFESPRSGGGDVENIEFDKATRSAILRFEQHSVLESVLSREQLMDGKKLEVTRHYTMLGNTKFTHQPVAITDHRDSGNSSRNALPRPVPTPRKRRPQSMGTPEKDYPHTVSTPAEKHCPQPDNQPGTRRIEVDVDLYQFLQTHHPANLNEAVHNAQATVRAGTNTVAFILDPSRVDIIQDFLNAYKCEEIHFDQVLLKHGLEEEIAKLERIFLSSKAVALERYFIKGTIKIVGRAIQTFTRVVEEVTKLIEAAAARQEEETRLHEHKINVPSAHIKVLQNSGKYQALKETWQQDGVRLEERDHELVIKCSRKQTENVCEEIQKLVQSFGERVLEPKLSLFLVNPLVTEHVSALLSDKHLEIEFSRRPHDQRTVLYGIEQAHVDEAYRLITNTVGEFNISLDDNSASLRSQEARDAFQGTMPTIPMTLLVEGDDVTIVCLEKNVTDVRFKMVEFLENREHDTLKIPLEKAVARYCMLHGEPILAGLRLSSPKITIRMDNEGIILTGPKTVVSSCRDSINQEMKELITERMRFGTPETSASIMGETAEKIILGIEQERACAIVMNVIEESVETRGLGATSSTADCAPKVSAKNTLRCRYVLPNGKRIEVYLGDILEHPVDFLVNSANEELKHSGGLAKAIVDKGGEAIQKECFDYLRNNGKLMISDVVTTDGGRLLCRKVLHVVVPKWNKNARAEGGEEEETKEGRYIRHGCLSLLDKARNGKTVAIPCLGTGIYSVPYKISARSMLAAVHEFLTNNTVFELKEIHFIDNNPDAVDALVQEMRRLYGRDANFELKESAKPVSSPAEAVGAAVGAPATAKSTFQTPEGMVIELIPGNIAESEVDLIISTIHKDLDLSKNPCSKALLHAGGKQLSDYCVKWLKNNNEKPLDEGAFAETDGGKLKCKKVFHVRCHTWKSQDGEKKLRELVKKLLTEAKKRGFKSIAMPALGTGSLRYPLETVAKVLLEEPKAFSAASGGTSCLKLVKIVVYQNNKPAVEKFRDEFQRLCGNAPAPIAAPTAAPTPVPRVGRTKPRRRPKVPATTTADTRPPLPNPVDKLGGEVTVEINGFEIVIVQGNMLDESTDAVAFLTGNSLREGGQIGKALLRAAGEVLEQEYNAMGKIESGCTVMTTAGNLKTKSLLHMVPKKSLLTEVSSGNMRDCVQTCLVDADSMQLQSISLPAVGSGQLRKTGKESADIMCDAIGDYVKRPKRSIKRMRIVILDETVFREFQKRFVEQANTRFGSLRVHLGNENEKPRGSTARGEKRVRKRVVLDIVAGNANQLAKIKQDLTKIEQERCCSDMIEDEMIAKLPPKYFDNIMELEHKYSVRIDARRHVGSLRFSGLTENVANAKSDVKQLLLTYEREKNKVALTNQHVQWLYYDGKESEPEVIPQEYDEKTSAEIEEAHRNKRPAVEVGENPRLRIDFKTMEETNVVTGEKMKVHRSSREGFPLPTSWELQPIVRATGVETKVYLVNLDKTDNIASEYGKTFTMFKDTMPNAEVLSIERIQNPGLYGTYKSQEKAMNERGLSNEQRLFHGTTKEVVININEDGFNRSYCGKNAVRFGKGVYFARKAKYSANKTYAKPDAEGKQYMYVASVLVGQYTKGKEGLLVPPAIENSPTGAKYDSVVDDVANPGMFIVFYDPQCYPEYLITFKNN